MPRAGSADVMQLAVGDVMPLAVGDMMPLFAPADVMPRRHESTT